MLSSIPEVPPSWIKVRFDEIATNITDRVEKPNESDLEHYIGLEHLDTDQIRIKRFGSTEDVKATKFLCKKGDIIFGKRNSYLRKVAVTDRDAVVSAHSMVIRPKGDLIVPDFLPCFMQSNVFWKTAHAISEGSMSPTIKWKTLAKQEFWIPSAEEQKKISEVLWAIEDNIDKNEHLLKSFDGTKKCLLNELLNKGIGHNNFKETEFGAIPESWDFIKLKDILKINKSSIDPQQYSDELFLYYTIPGYDVEKTIYLEKGLYIKSLKYVIKKDSILLSKLNPRINRVWKVMMGRENRQICSTEFIVYEPEKSIDINYLYYLFQSSRLQEEFIRLQTGTSNSHKRVSPKETLKISVPLPQLDEQKNIANILIECDENLKYHRKNILHLTNLKKKLTNEFLSGKLRIPEGVLENVQ
jgi:type I restriction enzyme S subunit